MGAGSSPNVEAMTTNAAKANGGRFIAPAHITIRLLREATSTRQNVACHPAAFYGTLPSIKTMKKLIWLLPLLIILGAILVAVEIKGSSPTHEITISYGNLADTSGRLHSVQLVLHADGSVTWRDLTRHIR